MKKVRYQPLMRDLEGCPQCGLNALKSDLFKCSMMCRELTVSSCSDLDEIFESLRLRNNDFIDVVFANSNEDRENKDVASARANVRCV
jgi:hypothetical protein